MQPQDLGSTVFASLMAAMIAVGAYIHIPVGPVPVVLQNLFVLLAGLLLGSRWALASVAVYLLVGAAGIPVFSGGRGGLAHFAGPTGGYLAGFALAAWVTGWIAQGSDDRPARDILAVTAGSLCIYVLGVPWLKATTAMSWLQSLGVGMAPFLPGDIAKAAAAVILARSVRPFLRRGGTFRSS